MKNQYIGDIGDYGKYGLLRFLKALVPLRPQDILLLLRFLVLLKLTLI